MPRIIFAGLLVVLLTSTGFAQKKVIKARPAEEERKKEAVVKKKKEELRKRILRSKLQRPPLTNSGGAGVHVLDNKYMGFSGEYGRLYRNAGWSIRFSYYTVPSDQFYFDPYYWQFVQRDRGSMLMLALNSKILLPLLRNQPNISPFWTIGAGPVLGIQTDWSRQFPGSVTHAYSIGGYTVYIGPGMDYFLGDWFMNFNIHYQLLRFTKPIFGKDNFDGFSFSIGFGKVF